MFRNYLQSLKQSTLRSTLELLPKHLVADWSNVELVATLTNGSTISFIGCDQPDKLGSIELTMAVIDEATEVSEEALTMIAGRLSGHLERPAWYSQMPKHAQQQIDEAIATRTVVLACNPKSPSHYLYKRFFEQPRPGHKVLRFSTLDNENLPLVYLVNLMSVFTKPEYDSDWIRQAVAKIRAKQLHSGSPELIEALTELGQRNLLGIWIAAEGAVYQQFKEDQHVIDLLPEHKQLTKVIGAVDFGYQNPRVAVLYEYDEELLVCVDYWLGQSVEPETLIKEMARLTELHDIDHWYLPHDQPGITKTARRTLGAAKVKNAKNAVLPGIGSVQTRLNKKTLLFLRKPGVIYDTCMSELQSYQWTFDKKTNSYLDQPLKVADHFPDAIRYGVYSLDHRKAVDEAVEPEQPELSPYEIMMSAYGND